MYKCNNIPKVDYLLSTKMQKTTHSIQSLFTCKLQWFQILQSLENLYYHNKEKVIEYMVKLVNSEE